VALTIYIGGRRYSSGSLRPYLALAHATVDFETKLIGWDQPDTKANILAVNPAGKVPVLHHDELVVWDSLAICEYAAELFPDAKLWPTARSERARARSVSAEMHAGFQALRREMPMDVGASKPGKGHTPEALADAARVQTIWRESLDASGGPFLFGTFTIADAMFAPVASRFATYGVALDDTCRRYADALHALPAMQAWSAEAAREPKTRE
jgi:glutathione S-transferase